MWEYLTPFRDDIYTFEEFLTAISKFPAFCGEKGTHGHAATLTADEVCQKEISTLFAHFSKETGFNTAGATVPAGYPGAGQKVDEAWRQALYFIREKDCGGSGCDYFSSDYGNDVSYPRPDSTTQYFGRGAFQLSWNYNYGRYSNVQFGDSSVLLNDPDRVARDGWLAIASAIWFYQTPQAPKPSMHDIVTGFWQPNASDASAGFEAGFGATINVINGGLECGAQSWAENARSGYYRGLMNYFGVSLDSTEVDDCQDQTNYFSSSGSAALVPQYFDRDWSSQASCKLVTWATPYSLFTPGDYKRCVCSFSSGCDL